MNYNITILNYYSLWVIPYSIMKFFAYQDKLWPWT